jgi:hypothetical protein
VKASVVSFDSLLSPGLMRRELLNDALVAHGVDPHAEGSQRVHSTLGVGRTYEECLRIGWSNAPRVQQDPTLLELIALDATRRYATWLRDGASLVMNAALLLDVYSASGTRRLILRADAARRDVIPFLESWNLHDGFAMIRCADDPPVASSVYRSSFCRSWEAIRERLTRWGVDRASVEIHDACDETKMVALQLLSGNHVEEVGY